MSSSMEIGEVWALCGWCFVLGFSLITGGLVALLICDAVKEVMKQ